MSPSSLGVLCLLTFFNVIGGCEFGNDCRFPCRCQGDTLCNMVTGSCPAGCNDGSPSGIHWPGAWEGPGCQVGNVAYNQPAVNGASTFESYDAGLAVDGIRETDLYHRMCSRAYTPNVTQPTYRYAWWSVDLGKQHVIYNVSIYVTDTHRSYFGALHIELRAPDDRYVTCGYVGESSEDYDHHVINVTCARPTVATVVRVRRMETGYTPLSLYMCEFIATGYVYQACENSRFGPGCLSQCRCTCDDVTGACAGDCDLGWLGPRCDIEAPRLNSPPVLRNLFSDGVEFDVPHWDPSRDSGTPPSSYMVQVRHELSDTWVNVLHLDMPTSGAATTGVHIQVDLDPTATTYLRVVPLVLNGGTTYYGYGESVALDADSIASATPTPIVVEERTTQTASSSPSSSSSPSVVVPVVVGLACLLIGFGIGLLVSPQIPWCNKRRSKGTYVPNASGMQGSEMPMPDHVWTSTVGATGYKEMDA